MSNVHDIEYYRQRNRNRAWEAVVRAVERANAIDGTKKKDIAEFLGVPPSQVSRWLSGPSNLGLDAISDLLLAAGGEMDYGPTRFEDRVPQNEHHELNNAPPPIPPKANTGTTSIGAVFKVVHPQHAEG